MAVEARITRNGQISLPAALRRRWGAESVLVIDRGDYVIVRPVLEDPVSALLGKYEAAGPTSEEARSQERAAEAAAEDVRARRG